ncbi:TPA: hypothetical protein VGS95_004514 [Vibrio parahaemolyticus]|nr:hypothetical protein [Vibrio parahaemolyticus]
MHNVINVLESIFQEYEWEFKAASDASLNAFKLKARSFGVPESVIEQLVIFYSQVDGVPCLDSLVLHSCDDSIIFEWWEDAELWLGSRDYHILRWSAEIDRFCIGDASNVSFGEEEQFKYITDAIVYLANVYSAD